MLKCLTMTEVRSCDLFKFSTFNALSHGEDVGIEVGGLVSLLALALNSKLDKTVHELAERETITIVFPKVERE